LIPCYRANRFAHGGPSLVLALTAVHEKFTAGDVAAFVGGLNADERNRPCQK